MLQFRRPIEGRIFFYAVSSWVVRETSRPRCRAADRQLQAFSAGRMRLELSYGAQSYHACTPHVGGVSKLGQSRRVLWSIDDGAPLPSTPRPFSNIVVTRSWCCWERISTSQLAAAVAMHIENAVCASDVTVPWQLDKRTTRDGSEGSLVWRFSTIGPIVDPAELAPLEFD